MLRQSKDREKMCNCMVLDVTAIFFWITAFLKKLPFLAKGLHSVCVCTVHQNVKLMWIGAKLNQLTLEDIPLKSYKHGLAQMTCNPPLLACHMGDCANCPQRSTFNEQLKVLMGQWNDRWSAVQTVGVNRSVDIGNHCEKDRWLCWWLVW